LDVDVGDDQDRGHNPVDDRAERRPPSRVRHVLVAVLPQILQCLADEAHDQQPGRTGDGSGGEQHEYGGNHALDDEDA
jgi:hypothetical protein